MRDYENGMLRLGEEEKIMKKIFICSPLRGNIESNIEKAKRYCNMVAVVCGLAPIAPHLLYPQFLDENVEVEREMGINCGLEFLKVCDELWAFCEEGEETAGMKMEIDLAKSIGIPVEYVNGYKII